MLHDICVSKTGTLTKAELSVRAYQLQDLNLVIPNDPVNNPKHFSHKLQIQDELKAVIKECIMCNTDVRIETNDDSFTYEAHGQPMEVGLINFLMEN